MKAMRLRKKLAVPGFWIAIFLFTLLPGMPGNAFTPAAVVKQWETEKILRVPESVLFHEPSNTLFISNIGGKPTEKNGQGFISKMSPDGNIIELKWATGLNAPKGSAIYKDRFYVSDIDELVEIDLRSGKPIRKYPVKEARFLNDVAADAAGNIYVTDYSAENSAIYILEKGSLSVWIRGPDIDRPNGLHMEKGRLLVGNTGDGSLKAIGLADKKIEVLAKVGIGIDGLRPDGNGNYLVSNWAGKTAVIHPDGAVDILLDTTDQGVNAADLEYIIRDKLLLIPTFFDNRVVAYRLP